MKKFLAFCLFVFVFIQHALAQDGTLDTSFDPQSGFDGTVNVIVRTNDGKYLVGGTFTSYKGSLCYGIAKLDASGVLDTDFNNGVGLGFDNAVETIAIQQNDYKIIVGGRFTTFNNLSRNRIARLNTDGTLDTGFNIGTGFNTMGMGPAPVVYALAVQMSGKILAGGEFTSFNNQPKVGMVRLETNGNLDMGFDIGTIIGTMAQIRAIVIDENGKLLIAGGFKTVNGAARNSIVRINENGTLDASFGSINIINERINALALQDDGRIIIGGLFTTVYGVNRNYIARLNQDGTLDANFNPSSGFNGQVNTMVIQKSDGKCIAGGNFTLFNGVNRKYITRLNQDGTLDTSFDPMTSFDGNVNTLLYYDQKIMAGGTFNNYKGVARYRIARIGSFSPEPENQSILLPTLFTPNGDTKNDVLIVRGKDIDEIILRVYDRRGKIVFETKDLNKATVTGWDGDNQPNGVYICFVKAKFMNGSEKTLNAKVNLMR